MVPETLASALLTWPHNVKVESVIARCQRCGEVALVLRI